jgi:hypothetical protein
MYPTSLAFLAGAFLRPRLNPNSNRVKLLLVVSRETARDRRARSRSCLLSSLSPLPSLRFPCLPQLGDEHDEEKQKEHEYPQQFYRKPPIRRNARQVLEQLSLSGLHVPDRVLHVLVDP